MRTAVLPTSSSVLEEHLPGTWALTFVDAPESATGYGEYTFKLAGTFNAEVASYEGREVRHGYWQVTEENTLRLDAMGISPTCGCLADGLSYNYTVELERVGPFRFSGVLHGEDKPIRAVFVRIG